jgi:hypothetical protein
MQIFLPVCTCRLPPFFETAGSYLKIRIFTILKITADFIFGKLQQSTSLKVAADFILKNYGSLHFYRFISKFLKNNSGNLHLQITTNLH